LLLFTKEPMCLNREPWGAMSLVDAAKDTR
jgi:hypothetical protein